MSDKDTCSVIHCTNKNKYPSALCEKHLAEITEPLPTYQEIRDKAVERFKLALLSPEAVEAATEELENFNDDLDSMCCDDSATSKKVDKFIRDYAIIILKVAIQIVEKKVKY